MKKSEKISALSGISLLIIAALFLVALLLQLIPFGNKASAPFLSGLGGLLYGAYGYSSLLIPAFFFAAGLGCFLFPWNERIGVLYASSCIPFFTVVICEKVCAEMLALGNSPLVGIQVSVAIIVCILVLGIEYFAASYVGGYILNKLRAGTPKPAAPKTEAYPPIFPEGIIQEDIVDFAEDDAIAIEAETATDDASVEDVALEALDNGEEVAFEEREFNAEEQFHSEANFLLKEELPEENKFLEETKIPVENDFPLEDEVLEEEYFPVEATLDSELEEALAIEKVYVQDEEPIRKPLSSPIQLEAQQDEPELNQAFQNQIESEELEQISSTESANEADLTAEYQEEVVEDVFGEDFFATAPVPEEDVFSKEYIEEFQLQKKASQKENLEAVAYEAPAQVPEKDELQAQEEAEEAVSEEEGVASVHFQPIPQYSLDPTPVAIERNLEFDSPELENPGEAAFFEDPFGDNSGTMDDSVVTQASHLEDESLQLSESIYEDDFIVNEEHHVLDYSIVRQSLEAKESSEDDFCESSSPESDDFDIQLEEQVDDSKEELLVEADFGEEDLDDGEDQVASVEEEAIDDDEDQEVSMEDVDVLDDEAEETEPFVEAVQIQLPVVERAVPHRVRGPYNVPANELLTSYPDGEYWVIDEETVAASHQLKATLSEFKIEAEVTGIRKGPVITMFEILPAPGVKLSKIVALQDNIALRLAASSVRIVAPIPGKHAVGIEVPNKERAIVSFKELIDTEHPAFRKQAVPVVLGKDITGEAQVIDLAKTPHLLIAGSTGSGKSVCVNSLILSILFKRSPQEVRMILIDPKIVELKLYNDIPHLLTPVITEPKKAFQALQYCLCEMERRYALLDGMGVREITSYNKRIVERNIATEKLPYIVVIIDEFADLMATTGKELESTVARLAAMSRAVGIHLVLATQRPSIDVITGLIKANIPSRIAFMVASKMDSRIIIDQVGAEKLLGKGDMLYASATDPFPVRIQGTFVSDNEVENVVEFVKQYGEPDYIDDEIFVDDEEPEIGPSLFGEGDDPLYDQAVEIVMQAGKASASYIQRRLKIGYNRAARLVEEMEEKGLVGPANGSKPREIIHMP